MTGFHWVLLGLAIADLLYAVFQLFLLSSWKLVVYDMNRTTAWLVVVGPSALVLGISLLSLGLPTDTRPIMGAFVLLIGYVLLALVVTLQVAATVPIIEKRREWDTFKQERIRRLGKR